MTPADVAKEGGMIEMASLIEGEDLHVSNPQSLIRRTNMHLVEKLVCDV